MAKSVKRQPSTHEVELRRWCVEQAMRWPVYGPGYAQGAGIGQAVYSQNLNEANIMDRANRLWTWVNSK